jgi:tetratricopeptide (TPR) repeat protein
MKVADFFNTLPIYFLSILIILTPVFVVGATTAPLVIPRVLLISIGTFFVLLLYFIGSIIKGKLSFSVGKFDIFVVLTLVAYIASAVVKVSNESEALFFPGVLTFVVSSCLLYFLLNHHEKGTKNLFSSSLVVSAVLLSLMILFTQIGLFSKIPQLPSFLKDPNFNPMGGVVPSLIYLSVVTPLSIGFTLSHKEVANKLFFGVASAIILAGVAINILNMLPGKPQTPRFPTLAASWGITAETLKESPFLGIGPGNYLTAFNRFRPLSYNQTDLWPVKFGTANNYYLTSITETGLLGALAIIILMVSAYKLVTSGRFSFEKASLIILLALLLVFPASQIIIVLMFIILALSSRSEDKTIEIFKHPRHLLVMLISIPFIVTVFAIGYLGINMLKAELTFQKALEALADGDAKATYDNLRLATSLSPKTDRYHITAAQVNLALASNIASKENITDNDRSTVSQLVQASIAEGKASVALNPQRSGNWELLARIYRSVMPFAQGADNFAVQTFTQAIVLDPINPNLRIALGGVYYSLGRYDEAIEAFRLAVVAKPDFANSHYNLAAAYREKGDIKKATEAMNTVLSLVGKDTTDYQTALKELKDLEGLTPPPTVEESNINPPIELPQEANPPQGQ